jgi:hypothetical protein
MLAIPHFLFKCESNNIETASFYQFGLSNGPGLLNLRCLPGWQWLYHLISRFSTAGNPACAWPDLFYLLSMENTFTLYIDALNEQWEMPDSLAIKWQQYEAENPVDAHNADKVHLDWFGSLSPGDQKNISRHTPHP